MSNIRMQAPSSSWLHVEGPLVAAARALAQLGYGQIEQREAGFCEFAGCDKPAGTYVAFTAAAMKPGILLQTWRLKEPVPALHVRTDVAIEDATPYELLCRLLSDDWVWKARGVGRAMVPYKVGGEKVFYSSPTASTPLCSFYARALLFAEETITYYVLPHLYRLILGMYAYMLRRLF